VLDTASKATLENEFGTSNDDECIIKILETGEAQQTQVRYHSTPQTWIYFEANDLVTRPTSAAALATNPRELWLDLVVKTSRLPAATDLFETMTWGSGDRLQKKHSSRHIVLVAAWVE
jgi:hypothetical protein